MQPLLDLVAGKSVALVGNAMSILNRRHGAEIDAHDVVIRINLGLPGHSLPLDSIGRRTDVWAAAKYWHGICPMDAKLLVFMKLTTLGDKHWTFAQRLGIPSIRWPQTLEAECEEFVGASPSSGIRMLWLLKKRASPASVTVFGMDGWKTPTHWSGRLNTRSHDRNLERAARERLLA